MNRSGFDDGLKDRAALPHDRHRCLIALALRAVVTANPWLLLGVPLVGYGFARVGHFFFERGKPATVERPVFSPLCDFLMFRDVLLRHLPW